MHTLILGQSFTGKSALAKQLGTSLRAKNQIVIAFNPTKEAGYTIRDSFDCQAAQFESDNPDAFVRELTRLVGERHPKIFCIVDEAHEFFSRNGGQYDWIGTKGRHYGIHVIAITQRAAMISTTFRGQCSTIYAFRSNRTDMEFLREEFWHTGMTKEDFNLQPGKFVKITPQGVSHGDIADW